MLNISKVLLLVGGLAPMLHATITNVSMKVSPPPPQLLGTTVTLNVTANDSDPGPITVKWEVQNPGSSTFSVLRDFTTTRSFTWSPNYAEGTYQIRVTVRDYLAGTSAQQTTNYSVLPLVTGTQAVVVATPNPLVALFSAPNCPAGSTMTVYFKPQGSGFQNNTDARPCHPGTQNFYIGGMTASTAYTMNYVVTTNGATTKGTPVAFTTGPIPTSLSFPTISIPVTAGPQTDSTNRIVLSGYPDPGGFPIATDLSGNIIWYYTKVVQLVRPVPGGTILSLPSGPGTGTGVWGPDQTRQQIVREIDLSGNTVRETNCDRVYEQLQALGLSDPLGRFNHDAIRFTNGQTMVLGDVQRIFPAGTQQSAAPIDVVGALLVVLDTNFQVVSYWNAFDHMCTTDQLSCLNINRAGDEDCAVNSHGQTPGGCPPVLLSSPANDWMHNNSIELSVTDGDLLASMRNQNWIVKIDYQNGTGTGNILWRLGYQGNFTLGPGGVSDPYPWFSGQHDAGFINDTEASLMVFDNANIAHVKYGENSRGQVWNLNYSTMQATLAVNQDLGSYSPSLGSAQLLNNGDYMFQSGNIKLQPGTVEVQSTEWTTSGTNVYEYQSLGPSPSYRGWRMQDLYHATLNGSSGPM